MSDSSARSLAFRGTGAEAFAALRHAADLTGLRFLSGDRATGTYVFTAGMTVMSFGEKVTARITQLTAETVQVTLSSDLQFGVVGAMGRAGGSEERLWEALTQLLSPPER
jgi:hypothetical protein